MVYLSKGNAYWIKRKLKIGALLLTFNSIVYGTNGQDSGYSGCYLAPLPKLNHHLVGINIGAESVNHNNPNLNTTEDLAQTTLPNAYGSGIIAGLSYEYQIGDPWETLSSIICNLQYDTKPGSVQQNIDKFHFVDVDEGIVDKYSRVETEYKFTFITAEVLYKQNFIQEIPLGIIFGPYISYPLTLRAKETLFMPVGEPELMDQKHDKVNKIYENEQIVFDDEINNTQAVDVGLKTGFQYEIIIFTDLIIVPYLTYRFPLTLIQKYTDWKVSSFDIGISVRFRI
jgi:hypothetical protein